MVTNSHLGMFKSARIRLTTWYLIIIMLVSVSFSLVVYRLISFEYDRFLHMQQMRFERRFAPPLLAVDPDLIIEARQRLGLILFAINGGILVLSGLGGWILSGRTLKPIAKAIKDQENFISDASHELKTPLASLKTAQEVALRDPKISRTELVSTISQNLSDLNRLEKLTISLLQLSRASEHKLKIQDLSPIILDAIQPFKSIVFQPKNVCAYVDYGSLRQIITILLDNAKKYSKKGTEIKVELGTNSKHARIKVIDRGIGIPRSLHQKIFTRFYRADASRNQKIAGFGLGLSIAKRLTEEMHGTIAIESEVGKGSTFTVSLPLQPKFRLPE